MGWGTKQLAENNSANVWVRVAALDALVTMVCVGYLPREEVIDYFRSLYTGKMLRNPDNNLVWSQLVNATCDLYPEELIEEIKQAFADDLVDPLLLDWEEVERQLGQGKDRTMEETCNDPHHILVEDTIEELESWAVFQQPESASSTDAFPSRPEPTKSPLELLKPTPIKSKPTPGRNDPCWCGSGRKYKNCHWREDQRA